MSKQLTGGSRVCVECKEPINTGGYCDVVYVQLKTGKEELRYLHDGPCCMSFIQRTGIDILRMVHPVVPAQAVKT